LWSFIEGFIRDHSTRADDHVQFATLNDTTRGPDPAEGYIFDKVDYIPGAFHVFKNHLHYANSEAKPNNKQSENDRFMMKKFTSMVQRTVGLLKKVFGETNPMFNTDSQKIGKYSFTAEDAWLRHSGILGDQWTQDKFYSLPTGLQIGATTFDAAWAGVTLLVMPSGSPTVITYKNSFEKIWVDLELGRVIESVCVDYHSMLNGLMLTYLSAKITEERTSRLISWGVKLTWAYLFLKPNIKSVGNSGIAIEPGETLQRGIVMPEARMGESMEGQYYKVNWQAWIHVLPGLPENFATYDNIHLGKYKSGDTTNPTPWDKNWKLSKRSKGLPECIISTIPLFWEKPKNFVDLSGVSLSTTIGTSRCIPGRSRLNYMWDLSAKAGFKDVLENYTSKRIPNDVETRRKPDFINFLLDISAPHFEYNQKLDQIKVTGTGFHKDISTEFFVERWQGGI